jgi:hypothetical protein
MTQTHGDASKGVRGSGTRRSSNIMLRSDVAEAKS